MENTLQQVIKTLDERYPNRLPTMLISEYDLGVLVGQRELIDYLKQVAEYEEIKEQEVK